MALLSAGLINGAVVLSFHRPRASKGTGTRSASAAGPQHSHLCYTATPALVFYVKNSAGLKKRK